MRKILLFDDYIKCRSGKRIAYYHEQAYGDDDDSNVIDQALM